MPSAPHHHLTPSSSSSREHLWTHARLCLHRAVIHRSLKPPSFTVLFYTSTPSAQGAPDRRRERGSKHLRFPFLAATAVSSESQFFSNRSIQQTSVVHGQPAKRLPPTPQQQAVSFPTRSFREALETRSHRPRRHSPRRPHPLSLLAQQPKRARSLTLPASCSTRPTAPPSH